MGANLKNDQKLLLNHFNSLTEADKKSLLSYAEFLSVRSEATATQAETNQMPEILARPRDESVPKAIKRLSLSYPMLQDTELLHSCSGLMSDHILKGRAAESVIDELELLFRQSYKNYQNDK